MKNRLIFFTLFSLPLICSSQSIKPMDYCDLMKSNDVRKERVEVISFNEGVPVDTCILAEIDYDEQGRMVRRQDFFSGGRKLSEEQFFYDLNGKIDSMMFAHVFDQFQLRKFNLTYSSDGNLVQRSLDVPIRNSWCRERFDWDSQGRLREVRQFRRHQDQIILMKSIDYSLENEELYKESSIMFVRAENGLLLVENIFGVEGISRMVVHTYVHDDLVGL